MSRLPDLVLDSKLDTYFDGDTTVHRFHEVDEGGRRSYLEEHWIWKQDLGHGGFGKVQLERCVKRAVKQVSLRAVKVVNKPSRPLGSLDLSRELEAIAKFSNDRYKRWFVKSFGWYEDNRSIFITMEYCRHGDLHHYLASRRSLPDAEVQIIIYQVLEGLHQMHQNEFAHRDLKPGNILIKSMPPEEDWWVVLADFGISKRGVDANAPTTVIKGTHGFMAPELLKNTKLRQISAFQATDMWAVGEITFQMLTGKATFGSQWELIEYYKEQLPFPLDQLSQFTTDNGKEFISSLMKVDPNDRINTAQCLDHCWMESHRVNFEKAFSGLNLEQSSPSAPVQSDYIRNYSASWSNLSCLESEPTQITAPQYQQMYDKTLIRGVPETSQGSLFVPEDVFKTLEGHSDEINDIAFSPDGKMLASASLDGTVRLWDGQSGAALKTIKTYSRTAGAMKAAFGKLPVAAVAVAFSPGGEMLASASGNKIKLWDSRSGAALKTLEDYSSRIYTIAFSPDGKTLASASKMSVKLWDSRSGAALKTLNGHSGSILAAVFSPDGKILASTSVWNVKLWDSGSGAALTTLEGGFGSARSTIFSPDGKILASASEEGVDLWDSRSGAALKTLEGHSSHITDIAFSPDGKTLASTSRWSVKLWDSRSGAALATLGRYSGRANTTIFSPDGKILASASGESVNLWDSRSGAALKTLEGHSVSIRTIAFSPDGKTLASASGDRTVKLWR